MNKIQAVKGITKLYFCGALAGSFIHIVTAAHKLGGQGIEAYATPFMIDGIAIIGMVMRSDDFSKRTNKIGFIVQCVMGALSLTMNILAAHNLFGVLFGIAIVGLFVFAEWLGDQIEGREVDTIREAEATVSAAAAYLANCTHRTTCSSAAQCSGKAKAQKTRTRNARQLKAQNKALQSLMTP